jgi:hypothetical protein
VTATSKASVNFDAHRDGSVRGVSDRFSEFDPHGSSVLQSRFGFAVRNAGRQVMVCRGNMGLCVVMWKRAVGPSRGSRWTADGECVCVGGFC